MEMQSRRTSKFSLVYFTFFLLNIGLSWGRDGEMSSGEIYSEKCSMLLRTRALSGFLPLFVGLIWNLSIQLDRY